MTTLLIILIILAVIVVVFLAIILLRSKNVINQANPQNTAQNEGLNLILQQINEMSRTVDQKMGDLSKTVDAKINDGNRSMQESMRGQLSESAKIIKEVTQGLTKLDETNRQVVSFADQLQSLQDILKNPKQRGILGEYYLETLLKNVLAPGQYQMQYEFRAPDEKGGKVIVDAVVFVKDKIIPIDSKFSLENYNKLVAEKDPLEKERLEKLFINDLKNRIQETSKYIRPAEKTMDFAFMFIPHEAIYYDLLINKIGGGTGSAGGEADNLIQRAANKYKVIIVSPTSFLAYLQTVLQGLKAMQIEETAKDIVKHVEQLGTHLKKYEEYHTKLGTTLGTVINHYNNSGKELKKVDKDILRIAGEAPGIEVPVIEGPDEQ